MKFVVWLLVNAASLGVAIWLFDGITLTGNSTSDKAVTLLIVGGIFGLITSVLKPIVKVLSLPLIILSLGLMLLVINAFCCCSPARSPTPSGWPSTSTGSGPRSGAGW